jgi:hypothetical protein
MPWWLWLIIILVAIGAVQSQVEKLKKHTSKTGLAKPNTTTPYFWPVDDGYTYVTGTTHYQKALKAIAGTHGNTRAEVYCVALIVPDGDNPHDDQAVRIDINGQTVGHLPRDDARAYRKRCARKKMEITTTQCAAKVWGGFDRNNEPSEYGVDIYIKPFGA